MSGYKSDVYFLNNMLLSCHQISSRVLFTSYRLAILKTITFHTDSGILVLYTPCAFSSQTLIKFQLYFIDFKTLHSHVFDFACFFLPSFSSLIKTCIHAHSENGVSSNTYRSMQDRPLYVHSYVHTQDIH